MGKYTTLALAFLNYRNDIKNLTTLPRWKRELNGYNSRPSKPITLPSIDTTNILDTLPKAEKSYVSSQVIK